MLLSNLQPSTFHTTHSTSPMDCVNDPLVTGIGIDSDESYEQRVHRLRQAVTEAMNSKVLPPFDWHDHLRELNEQFS